METNERFETLNFLKLLNCVHVSMRTSTWSSFYNFESDKMQEIYSGFFLIPSLLGFILVQPSLKLLLVCCYSAMQLVRCKGEKD